jgi:hypothetical protein
MATFVNLDPILSSLKTFYVFLMCKTSSLVYVVSLLCLNFQHIQR